MCAAKEGDAPLEAQALAENIGRIVGPLLTYISQQCLKYII